MSNSPQDLRVGFVGLGNMGAPMVRNLAKAGFALTLYDANEAAQTPLVHELGATAAGSPADFARTDVVVTMLPDDRAVVRSRSRASASWTRPSREALPVP